jgi:hypothetical protein
VLLLAPEGELDASVNEWLAGALQAGVPQQLLRQALER